MKGHNVCYGNLIAMKLKDVNKIIDTRIFRKGTHHFSAHGISTKSRGDRFRNSNLTFYRSTGVRTGIIKGPRTEEVSNGVQIHDITEESRKQKGQHLPRRCRRKYSKRRGSSFLR